MATRSLEGALSLREEARYHIHLALCPHCRRYVKQIRIVRDAVAFLPGPYPSAINRLRLRQHFARCHPPRAVMN